MTRCQSRIAHFRLYGPPEPYYEGSWAMLDIEQRQGQARRLRLPPCITAIIWFWVDEGDWQTKRALTAVMFFFTLAETGAPERLPLITIPAQ